MLLTLATGALLAFAPPQADTTIQVARGQRLEVDAHAGDVTVHTWSRNAVRVVAGDSPHDEVEVSASGGLVSVRTSARHGPTSPVDLDLSVPAWMGVDISGVYGDVTVDGVEAPVSVETVQGDVTVRGGRGTVALRSVEGSVEVTGARGRLALNSVNDDVRVSSSSGEVSAETVNGEIELDRVAASAVNASTVNGDIVYGGPLNAGGRYSLATHNGDITLEVAQGASAAVSVTTFGGEFESDFPVTIRETRKGKRFSFTIGGGAAQVELESFEGTIHLARPGAAAREAD